MNRTFTIAKRGVSKLAQFKENQAQAVKRVSDIIKRNNALELVTELRTISVSHSMSSVARRQASLTEVVTALYISNENAAVEEVDDAIRCLQAVLPSVKTVGYIDLINACIATNHLDKASSVFAKAHTLGTFVDLVTAKSLIQRLSQEGNVSQLLICLKVMEAHNYSMCEALEFSSEALIVSGYLAEYTHLLKTFLRRINKSSNVTNFLKDNLSVTRILSSVIFAVLRRDFAAISISIKESHGFDELLQCIIEYHSSIEQAMNLSKADIQFLPSYVAYDILQRMHSQQGSMGEEMFMLSLLPPVDISGSTFPFLLEDDLDLDGVDLNSAKDVGSSLRVVPKRRMSKIKTLAERLRSQRAVASSSSAYELEKKVSSHGTEKAALQRLLFCASIFPESYVAHLEDIQSGFAYSAMHILNEAQSALANHLKNVHEDIWNESLLDNSGEFDIDEDESVSDVDESEEDDAALLDIIDENQTSDETKDTDSDFLTILKVEDSDGDTDDSVVGSFEAEMNQLGCELPNDTATINDLTNFLDNDIGDELPHN